jgi:hypothetical protein
MSKLVFYRQRRMDEGTRTGIDLDGELVFGLYEEGEAEKDPALRWFVDLRCEGSSLPRTPRGAKKWLIERGAAIADGFKRYAEIIRAGIDPDIYSLSWNDFVDVPKGIQLELVLSAIRRVDALEMSTVLRDIGSRWPEIMQGLRPVQEVHPKTL